MRADTRPFLDRYLEPADRLNEVLFGLIMVLTFTLTAGIAIGESPDAVRELLIATVGCNLAWGVIDGAMFVMTSLMERSRREREIARVREARDEATAFEAIARYSEGSLADFATADERDRLYPLIREAARRAPGAARTRPAAPGGRLRRGREFLPRGAVDDPRRNPVLADRRAVASTARLERDPGRPALRTSALVEIRGDRAPAVLGCALLRQCTHRR